MPGECGKCVIAGGYTRECPVSGQFGHWVAWHQRNDHDPSLQCLPERHQDHAAEQDLVLYVDVLPSRGDSRQVLRTHAVLAIG